MADISAELAAIESAVYGEEVRDAIHDGLEKMNSDLNTAIGTQVIDRATVDEVLASEALSLKYSNYEEIPGQSNLNSFAGTANNYWISNANAQTITNMPVARAGRLFVFPAKGSGANDDGGIQLFISSQNAGNAEIWFRGWKGSSWKPWNKVTTDSDVTFLRNAFKYSDAFNYQLTIDDVGIKVPFRSHSGDRIQIKTVDGSDFTVTRINLLAEDGSTVLDWKALAGNGSSRTVTVKDDVEIFYASIAGDAAQSVYVTNLSSPYNLQNAVGELQTQIADYYSLFSQSNNIVETTELEKYIPFYAKQGQVITVKSRDGSNMTPHQIQLYTDEKVLITQYWLDNSGIRRRITLNSDVGYIKLNGGTAQDIIVTNDSMYLPELISKLSNLERVLKNMSCTELTELDTIMPFYAKAEDTIKVSTKDQSDFTVTRLQLYGSDGTTSLKWYQLSGNGNTRTVTLSDIIDDVYFVGLTGGTAQEIAVVNKSAHIPSMIFNLDDRVSTLESKSSSSIPSYYSDHLASKEAIIRSHNSACAMNGDSLIFITDTHFSSDLFTSDSPASYYNSNNSIKLIRHIASKTGIGMICFGGDLVNSAPDVDTMMLCMSGFNAMFGDDRYRLRYCVGNHEYFTGADFGQTTRPTPSELYGSGVKYNENVILEKGPLNTYYFDNVPQKIRYFVIACGRDTELGIEQITWVLNAFKNVPAGYHIICIGHAFMGDAMNTFRGYYANIMGALDAIKVGSQYVFNNVTYNYSTLNNVTPVCAITGHTHITGHLTSNGGIPCICTTTDSYALNAELVDGTPTRVPRTKGTVNEQAFDVIQFDFTNRKIYCTSIGYGSNREFSF